MFAIFLLLKTEKNHIDISLRTLYSVLCWSTFGSDYSHKSFWVWRYKLDTPVFGEFLQTCIWGGSVYFGLFIFPSILTSLPVPTAEKHPQRMMSPSSVLGLDTILSRRFTDDSLVFALTCTVNCGTFYIYIHACAFLLLLRGDRLVFTSQVNGYP